MHRGCAVEVGGEVGYLEQEHHHGPAADKLHHRGALRLLVFLDRARLHRVVRVVSIDEVFLAQGGNLDVRFPHHVQIPKWPRMRCIIAGLTPSFPAAACSSPPESSSTSLSRAAASASRVPFNSRWPAAGSGAPGARPSSPSRSAVRSAPRHSISARSRRDCNSPTLPGQSWASSACSAPVASV